MYHSFLNHSFLSADGHLGCFHVLAIINSAMMNIGVHVSQMYGTDFWTLWEKVRVGCSERIALKQVYYQV